MENTRKYFIRLYNVVFEVSREQYIDYHVFERRLKYLREADEAHGLVSYQVQDSAVFSAEKYLFDRQESVEDIVIRKIMIECLRKALKRLEPEELQLIWMVFFEEKTEREISAATGVPQKTINDRKQKILSKLKNILEN